MMQRIKLARPTFTPDLAYRSLVPASQHRQFWEELRLEVRARSWPSLVRPWWLSIALIIGNLTIGVYIFMLVCAFSPVLWWLSVMMMIVVGIVMARLTKRFKTRIPYRCRKIRSIVPYAVTSEQIKWTREQVSAVVKQVVQEQLALSDVQYREDAHFIKDLGLGR